MNVEVTANVYSLVTVRKAATIDTLQRYLYDHTTVVEEHEYGDYRYFIVRTSATNLIGADVQSIRFAKPPIERALQLANYQLDRLTSGLMGGILAGSLEEAQNLFTEAVLNTPTK